MHISTIIENVHMYEYELNLTARARRENGEKRKHVCKMVLCGRLFLLFYIPELNTLC